MIELIDRAITRRGRKSSTVIHIDLAVMGARLSKSGEVAVLGFVHYYLGGWSSRAAEGTAPRPTGWPDLVYDYVPDGLTMPVICSEAPEVAHVLRSILARPNVLESTLANPS